MTLAEVVELVGSPFSRLPVYVECLRPLEVFAGQGEAMEFPIEEAELEFGLGSTGRKLPRPFEVVARPIE